MLFFLSDTAFPFIPHCSIHLRSQCTICHVNQVDKIIIWRH
uniref:Uncharacterized protein n=1 Tax=Anguilla anguilla TaxID=7936 RepID=A0A0E9TPN1_ANGAN